MQDEFEDNKEDYCSLTNEYWCELTSKIEAKDNMKRAATQINMIATLRAAYHSDSNEFIRVPRKNEARNGVFHKKQGKNTKNHGVHRYCVLFKKAVMSEKSLCHIALKTVLESVPTTSPSSME